MSTRQRTTWGGEHVLPVERARAASAHPATPDEGHAHPAYQADPEASDYENGDTSSWAEDVHGGPYSNSAHPATPDEGAAHPAHKAAAMELRAAVEQKAVKCLRVASVLLGKSASDRQVEKQALDLMDIPEIALDSTLTRLASLDLFASDGEDEDDVEEEAMASKKSSDDEDEDEEAEAKLASMLAEEGMDRSAFGGDAELESMLAEMMLEEEGMESEVFEEGEDFMEPEPLIMDDPMGMGDYGMMDDEEEMLLSQLFAGHTAAKKSEDEESEDEESEDEESEDDESEEVEEVEMASKKASQRPRPKKASTGPARLGGVAKEAASDVKELEKLWESAPDISGAF